MSPNWAASYTLCVVCAVLWWDIKIHPGKWN